MLYPWVLQKSSDALLLRQVASVINFVLLLPFVSSITLLLSVAELLTAFAAWSSHLLENHLSGQTICRSLALIIFAGISKGQFSGVSKMQSTFFFFFFFFPLLSG